MFQIIALTIALIALILDLILTILEAYRYYHLTYNVGAHPGSIRGTSVPAAVVMGGMRYNVKWIIWEVYYEEKEKES